MVKNICIVAFWLLLGVHLSAQIRWYNPGNESVSVVQGQGWPEELKGKYGRLPQRAKDTVRPAVWQLSNNSAGVAIHFYSNSPNIKIRYQVQGGYGMPHMPTTGVSGVDLYARDAEGNELWCAGKYSFSDTIRYHFNNLSYRVSSAQGYEYRLYLPLYNTVKWLEVGVDENSRFEFIPVRPEKPIIAYGTSICQGACASRPGMAWTNILERRLDYPLINLGFSGNGKLEKEVLDFVNEQDACLYILDCMPNLTDESEEKIETLIVNAVHQIRAKHPSVPILLTDHDGYANGETDRGAYESYAKTNRATLKAFEQLKNKEVPFLYHLSLEEMGMSQDAMVDGVHATDLGMTFYADAYEKIIRRILNMPEGKISTTRAVAQRREAPGYEWKKRHAQVLALNRSNPPRSVVIGNSIVHYWAGQPSSAHQRGIEAWSEYMEPAGFGNLGFGWDRIENMLWRIYHGELDGFQAEKVVVMAGTNNLETCTDSDILAGLDCLIEVVSLRQPSARIKLAGILPRRGMEKRIATLNLELKQLAKKRNVVFVDPGRHLLKSKNQIDEVLFMDGLHPNGEGYRKIAPEIGE